MSIEAMKQALEALEDPWKSGPDGVASAITALRAAIEQAQEPVLETVYETIIQWDEGGGKRSRRELARRIVALYTAPRQWQGLTEDEREQFRRWAHPDMIEAIELRLQERNT